MSKNKSKSRSGSSRSISRSRSRSFSKSRSRSRSLSHSRKRRHSSRSRSRSYSPGYNRDRNHPRVYQNRDFRGHNRGYRRPYYFRGRGRGFYPRGQHNRGGYINYRPNWQNYNRQPYSPRRARSRSRSPKRRSVSPRSRSHSRNSDKSSSDRSRRSSSSRSSSNHSRVETRRKSKKDKKSHSKDQRSSSQLTDDDSKEQSTSGGADPGSKEGSKAWQDMEAYDESPATQHSPSERAPTLKSSVQSVVVRRCSPRPSPGQKPSPPSPTGLQSSSSFRASSRQSPFEHSLSPPRKSPLTKSPPSMSSLYGSSQKEEGRSGEMTAPVGTGYKRFMEEQKNKALELEKENGKEKLEKMKDRSSPTDFAMSELERAYKKSMSPKRYKMREELEKMKLAELRYAKEEAEQEKKSRARKDSDSDSKSQDPYDPAKWEELSFIPSTKEKRKKSEDLEDELYAEKSKKEEKAAKFAHKGFLPEKNFKVTSFKASKERSESPPPRKSSESREKQLSKEDLSFSKSNFSVSRESGPSVRVDSFDEDLARPSGVMTHERKLSRDLVHSNKKDQEFKSIFQHIQSAQPQRSPSELFAQHIVTIVHHVKEHHFGPSTMTLSERFSSYLKKGKDQEPSKSRKSPEIHRRIDISPSAFRKHGILQEEGKQTKEGSHKGEGKYREEPSDLRQDIERRKKHKDKRDHSRDSGDSRDSSRSRERSPEKPEKPKKSSKKHKKHRKVRERSRSSSSSSHSSHSVRAAGTDEFPTENEDKDENSSNFEKTRLGSKEYQGTSDRGRARGTFQYRARGTRPWNSRGGYSGNNNNNNNDFQKRNRDEEWDPEYTPKSKKYYLHDDREGENEEKWVNRGRGRANFTRGRGRFLFRKPGTSPKWAHDKFSGEEGEIEEDESGAENKDEKGSLSLD